MTAASVVANLATNGSHASGSIVSRTGRTAPGATTTFGGSKCSLSSGRLSSSQSSPGSRSDVSGELASSEQEEASAARAATTKKREVHDDFTARQDSVAREPITPHACKKPIKLARRGRGGSRTPRERGRRVQLSCQRRF